MSGNQGKRMRVGLYVAIASIMVFASATFFNFVIKREIVADLLELIGTAGAVFGGSIVVSTLSPGRKVTRCFQVGAFGLILARFLDFTQEIPFLDYTAILGDEGWGRKPVMFTAEGVGYSCAFIAMVYVLIELVRLKNEAEEEHRSYRQVHEDRLFLARVADMSAEALFGCDGAGVVRTWNNGARLVFGYTPEEAIGLPLTTILEGGLPPGPAGGGLPPGPAGGVIEWLQAVGPRLSFEGIGLIKGGRRFAADVSVSLVSGESGAPFGASVVVRDIDQRKRMEQELIASRNLLSGALQNANVGLFILTRDGDLLEFNTRMQEITGMKEPVGSLEETCALLLDPGVPFAQTLHVRVFEEGQTGEFRNLAVHRRDGETRICNITVTPVFDADRQVTAAVAIAVDVTDHEVLQAKLLEAQKMESIGRLAGGVAHDFNNILSGILGYASLMAQKMDPSSAFVRYAKAIEDSAARAAELTHQLLAFARGDGMTLVPVNLNDVAREALKLVSRSLDPNIVLLFEPTPDVSAINADPSQIQQLLLNLCINSRDAIANAGVIRVETADVEVDEALQQRLNVDSPGRYVRLTVADSGAGMPPDVLQRMFEPFFSTKKQGKGYGLGLSVVYGIVTRHGGGLHVESDLGHGTRIDAYFPAQPEAPPRWHKVVTKEHGRAAGTETILVVDDEELVRTMVHDILNSMGYSVLEATTGEQALDVYAQRRGDIRLVILDLIMPGMGGTQAFQRLRALDAELRVIVTSGYVTDGVDGKDFSGHHVRFIPKPFQAMSLASNVRQLLDS